MKERFRELLTKGKTQELLDLLLDITKKRGLNLLFEETLLQSAKYSEYIKTRLRGTLKVEDLNVSISKINEALLYIINQLPDEIGTNKNIPNKIVQIIIQGHAFEANVVFGDLATLGRSPYCDFSFQKSYKDISNWHAKIKYYQERNEFQIEDLDSTNGTYLNGEKIYSPRKIKFDSMVRLGSYLEFHFKQDNSDIHSVGTLVYYSKEGKELGRYCLVPKSYIKIGNSLNHLKLPLINHETSIGALSCIDKRIYFVEHTEKIKGKMSKEIINQEVFNFESISLQIKII